MFLVFIQLPGHNRIRNSNRNIAPSDQEADDDGVLPFKIRFLSYMALFIVPKILKKKKKKKKSSSNLFFVFLGITASYAEKYSTERLCHV